MMNPLMECGHVGSGRTTDCKPVCAICVGDYTPSDPALQVVPTPDLTRRLARCISCSDERLSSVALALFKHDPEWTKDSFYCGCRGWD